MIKLCFFILSLFAFTAQAQSQSPAVTGGLAFGSGQHNPLGPNTNEIKMSNGLMLSLWGQKKMDILNFYLLGSLDYSKNDGTFNYNYISPTSINYIANNVNYNLESFKATLALRYKIIEDFSFRPYIEGGAVAAYSQFSFDNTLKIPAVTSLGSDYKMQDTTLELGVFCEAGVEADINQTWGLNLAVRYTHQTTRNIETLSRRVLNYSQMAYILGIYFRL